MAKKFDKDSKIVKKHAEKERTEIRRKAAAVTDQAWIQALLQRGAHGNLATSHENQPFVTPLLYYYAAEERAIYFHGALAGRLRANSALNPQVCFNVSEFGRMLPAKAAEEFNIEYNSVTVFGQIERVEEHTKAHQALQSLMDKYAPQFKLGVDYEDIPDEDVTGTAVYCIKIEEWSAKHHHGDADFPGAYQYPYPSLISAQQQPPALPED